MRHIPDRTSVTIDEAVGILIGRIKGPVDYRSIEENPSDEELHEIESLYYDIREDLAGTLGDLNSDLAEAKLDGLSDELVAAKAYAKSKHKALMEQAYQYLCAINEEISKSSNATLTIDTASSSHTTYITLHSLNLWSQHNYGISILGNPPQAIVARTPSAEPIPTTPPIKPWLIRHPKDPDPEQPWYTPARYFARQLIIKDSTLISKRPVLAKMVGQSLAGVGILKRGNKLPHDPGTILKAFTNVVF